MDRLRIIVSGDFGPNLVAHVLLRIYIILRLISRDCIYCFPSFLFLIVIKLCATVSHGCLLVLIFLRGQSTALEKDRQNLRSMLEALQEGIIWMLIYLLVSIDIYVYFPIYRDL